MIPYGTLANVATVIAGGTVGLLLGKRFPENVRDLVFQGLGLCTMAIGMSMALKMSNPLIIIFSMILGGIAGELARLEHRLAALGDRLKAAVKSDSAHFTDGLVTAFLLFCVGSMTIVGSLDEGLRGDPSLLYTKAMLDGFASIALASTYGVGVLFSVLPLFAFQYSISLFGNAFGGLLSQTVITDMSAVGGLLILGIGINLLGLRHVRIANLLPALAVAVALGYALQG